MTSIYQKNEDWSCIFVRPQNMLIYAIFNLHTVGPNSYSIFYHYLYKLNPWKIVRMKRIIQIHPLLFLKTIYWSKYAARKMNLNFFYEIWFGNWLLDYMKKKTYGRFENGSFLVENLSTHMFSRHSSFVTPLKNIWVFNIGILM